MRKGSQKFANRVLAALAVAVIGGITIQSASANLVVQVLVNPDNNVAGANDVATYTATAGQVVTLDIWAIDNPTVVDSRTETIQALAGSVSAATTGSNLLKGGLAAAGATTGYVALAPFNSAQYAGGHVDTNSDGFIDLLGAGNGANATQYVYGKAGAAQLLGTNGGSILFGRVTFTVDSNAAAGASTTVTWIPQKNSTGGNVIQCATYQENGTSGTAPNVSGAAATISIAQTQAVPLPAASYVGMALLGGIGVARKLRRR